MTRWRKTLTLFAAASLVLGVAACGDDDDDDTAVGAVDDTSETSEPAGDDEAEGDEAEGDEGGEGEEHGMEGNPCAPDAPADALPPAEELDPDATPVTVTATDYSFDGVDALAAGGTFGVTFVNEGTEMHELVVVRLADGEERPLEEIIASGEEPEMTEVGFALACPGNESAVNLEISDPGRYVAICMIPVGTTPEATEEPQGPPHASQGMVFEFEIA